VIFILPETKGISLERMDKLFGEVDAVVAGEAATQAGKLGDIAQSEHEKSEKHGTIEHLSGTSV
jgi:hypothetical protein